MLLGEYINEILTALDKKVRSNDIVSLKDLQIEHNTLRELAKDLSQHLSRVIELKSRQQALQLSRPVRKPLSHDKEAQLLKA